MGAISVMQKPYFVALDIDDPERALSLASTLGGLVGGFKLGPRLLLKYGSEFSQKIAKYGPLFIDHKFYDIPNTMLSSVRVAFESGASFTTVHAACGPEALQRLAELEFELNKIRPFQILAVTVLTSFSRQTAPTHWVSQDIMSTVKALAGQCIQNGISGLVCSPYEAKELKSLSESLFIVTPGVRLIAGDEQDQKRVMTPQKAMQQGASALVIGRPIVNAVDPLQVCQSINDQLGS